MHTDARRRAALALLLIVGCSGDPTPPTPDLRSGGCGPKSCSGCCMAELCLDGNTEAFCGLSGGACINCAASGQACVTGTCQGGVSCGTATCGTCCEGSQCVSSIDDTACGAGGVKCADCSAQGKTCDQNFGACVSSSTCGPSSCGTGCCKADTCTKGDQDAACGTGGGACADCTVGGKTCGATKSCEATPSCGPTTCSTGCCAAGVCETGDTSSQCGTSGAACKACSSPAACTNGACTVPSTSNWKVTAVSATFNTSKQWDGSGDLPDPYFGVDWGGCTSWNLNKCGPWQKDTTSPVWNADMGTVPASTLKGSWCAIIMDGDSLFACFVPYQTMASCQVTVTDADLLAGSKTITNCPCPDDNVNYLTSLKLQFTYVP